MAIVSDEDFAAVDFVEPFKDFMNSNTAGLTDQELTLQFAALHMGIVGDPSSRLSSGTNFGTFRKSLKRSYAGASLSESLWITISLTSTIHQLHLC